MGTLDRLVPPEAVEPALAMLVVGNLVDALATTLWLHLDLADESNPVMAAALSHGVGPFLGAKVLLVGLAAALLLRQRARRSTRALLVAPALLYAYVLGGHTGFLLVQAARALPGVGLG
jgi:hypothetical protein